MRNRTDFDIVGPDGRRMTVTPQSPEDTVADLAAALGGHATTALWVDGRRAGAAQRLVDVPRLRSGAAIELGTAPSPGPIGAPADPVVELAVIAGPSCRSWTALAPGRHSIGRSAHCAIRLGDPSAELHHGVVDVEPGGTVRFTQLTGRVPARLDARPCSPATPIEPGAVLEIGSSLLTFRAAAGPSATASPGSPAASGSVVAGADPWRLVVRRGPVADPEWACPELAIPDPPPAEPSPPVTALIGGAVALAGALVVASVLGQMMFALFALVGAIASFATWGAGIGAAARRRRVERRRYRARTERFRTEVEAAAASRLAHHVRRHRTIVETLDEVARFGGRIWERRPDDRGRMRLTAGLTTWTWTPPVAGWSSLPTEVAADLERRSVAANQPAAVVLEPGEGLAVHGEAVAARAVLRSLVVQLATWTGPADWQLLVVTRHPDRWAWAGWLPHAVRADGSLGVVAPELVEDAGRRLAGDRVTLVVTDDAALFDARTGPARRLVAARRAAVFASIGREQSVPSICGRVLRLGSTGGAEWSGGDGELPFALRFGGLDEETAAVAARRLAALTDPEDAAAGAASLPRRLSFGDIERTGPQPPDGSDDPVARIVARWRAGGADPAPCTPVGLSGDGVVDIDLVRDGPHGLIAGTTGSGKSELLRTLVVGLATRCSPDHLTFVLVDYKGGATFDACARLPHTVGLVTDLDEGGAARALTSLEAELRRRERRLRDVGAADLTGYRARPSASPLPRLVVVVDEFAALVQELPGFLASLVGIAQRGRSLGVHLLLATQRPAGVVSDDIRANTNLRLALRLHDAADARDVVGDELPATLSRSLAGRAVLRLGPGELVVFQTARCTGPVAGAAPSLVAVARDEGGGPPGSRPSDGPTELSALAEAIGRATDVLGVPPPHRPWLDPLPAPLDAGEVDRAVGDDPSPAPDAGEVPDAPTAGSVAPTGPRAPHDAIGLVDDPDRQARHPLRWDPADGNLALVGALGSGVTSTLLALAAALCRTRPPDRRHLYVIDAVGDAALDGLASIAHCGAVVRTRQFERLHRLLRRLDGELERRASADAEDGGAQVVVLVDGFDSLRASLASVERAETLAMLDRVTADGPAVGVSWIAAGPAVSRIESAERWTLGGLDGPVRAPGRLTVESSGLAAQVAFGAAGLAALPDRSDGRGPPPVEVLAERIDRRALGPSRSSGDGPAAVDRLVVGRAADRLDDAVLTIPPGDHVFVGGPSRSGKSTALALLVEAWREAHPAGRVVVVDRRRVDVDELAKGATLVVVDDADRVDDAGLAALAADPPAGITLLAAARPEAVRPLYGHWTRDVVRSRCGLVLTSSGEVDGELLGATLPRRTLIPPRPGLAWVVDAAGQRLAQLAMPGAGAVARQAGGSSPSR